MVPGNLFRRLRPFLGIIAMTGVGSYMSGSVISEESFPNVGIQNQMEDPRNADLSTNQPSAQNSLGSFVHYELRNVQTLDMIDKYNNNEVYLCAPDWVKNGVEILQSKTTHIKTLHVTGNSPRQSEDSISSAIDSNSSPKNKIPLSIDRKLFWLQLLSRNERFNVDGIIKSSLYLPGLTNQSVIISLKDITRQIVIVGEAETTHYGGYGSERKPQTEKVYICDLSALQFQKEENTGRLILLRKEPPLPSGILDDFIYKNVVGESRLQYEKAVLDKDRFTPVVSQVFGDVLFDTKAYKKFVAQDVILVGLAVNHLAEKLKDNIHFKFLKYGTGFFAGDFWNRLDHHILDGVLDGLEELFDGHQPVSIKSIELPFYELGNDSEKKEKERKKERQKRVAAFESKHRIKIMFSKDDALKSNAKPLIMSTTNCGDPHAVFGNEMGHQSVDAAIAENLKDKGNRFSPMLNSQMNEKYFSTKPMTSKI